MVLGRVGHRFLFIELSSGELELPQLGVCAQRKEEGRAHFSHLPLRPFGWARYEIISLAFVQE